MSNFNFQIQAVIFHPLVRHFPEGSYPDRQTSPAKLLARVPHGLVVRFHRAAGRSYRRPAIRSIFFHADDIAVAVQLQPTAAGQVIVALSYLVVADADRPDALPLRHSHLRPACLTHGYRLQVLRFRIT